MLPIELEASCSSRAGRAAGRGRPGQGGRGRREWRSDVERRLERAASPSTKATRGGGPRRRLAPRCLARRPARPWHSLPTELDAKVVRFSFANDLRDLEAEADRVEQSLAEQAAAEELERFRFLVDTVHDLVATALDLGEARRLLGEARPLHEPAKQLLATVRGELDQIEAFLGFAYKQLEREALQRRQSDWAVRGRTRSREFVKLDRGPPVMLHFSGTDSVEKVPFHDLDRVPLVERLKDRADQATLEQHRRGIGLYLFYGDEWKAASQYLGLFDQDLIERRDRRLAWKRDVAGDRRRNLNDRIGELEGYLTDGRLELARQVLASVRDRFAGTEELAKARPTLESIGQRMADLERARDLSASIDLAIRKGARFLTRDGQDAGIARAEQLLTRLDFTRKDDFPAEVSGLPLVDGGLSCPGRRKEPDGDWKEGLSLAFPYYQRGEKVRLALRWRIPAEGEGPVAVEVGLFGIRTLLLQLPGRPVQVLVDASRELGDSMTRAIKDPEAFRPTGGDWYLLAGAGNDVVIELGPAQAGRRSYQLLVDGKARVAADHRVKEHPHAKNLVEVRSVGPVLLERLEVLGRLER
ncbi:MAG: hypothetical protein R3F30_10675 [Planctomycetota bacterium]